MDCSHRFVCQHFKENFNPKECEDLDPTQSPFGVCPFFTAQPRKSSWKIIKVETEEGLQEQYKCLKCGSISKDLTFFCPQCGAAMYEFLQYLYCNNFMEAHNE